MQIELILITPKMNIYRDDDGFFYGRQWKLNLRATTANCERQMRVPQSEIQIRCRDNLTQIRKVLKNRFRVSTSDEKKEKKNFREVFYFFRKIGNWNLLTNFRGYIKFKVAINAKRSHHHRFSIFWMPHRWVSNISTRFMFRFGFEWKREEEVEKKKLQ